ncbi:photoreceptor cell maintenance [Tyrophagus putrescentiae]|nr:photoreceptor cell maintenance [Tyrophagus putrescentiae]
MPSSITDSENTTVSLNVELGESLMDSNRNNIKREEVQKGFTPVLPLKQKIRHFFQRKIWIFPLFSALLIPFLCTTIYLASVHQNHVEAIFPYLSDSGTTAPEAGYFSQLMDTIAIVSLIAAYGRYRQIKYYLGHCERKKSVHKGEEEPSDEHLNSLAKYNYIAWLFFINSMVGFVIVGNFRAGELVHNHMIGANIGFCSLFGYGTLMIYLSNQLAKLSIESKPVTMFLSIVLASAIFVVCFASVAVSVIQAGHKNVIDTKWRLHWSADQPGYAAHVLSAITEVLTINIFSVVMLCLFRRMKNFPHWADVFG